MLPAAACACACACHVGVCVCVCVCGGACVCGCMGACVSTCTLIPVKHASTLGPVKPVAVRESVAAWVSGVSACTFCTVKPVNWVPALALAALRVSLRVSVVLCLLAGCSVEPIGMRVRLRQYLYFCTRKASKLSTCAGVAAADALVLLVIICTFVPVKPVN
jgi:hypothetical protein